jgi:putative protease
MPAGDLEKAKHAIAYGADAVYAGVPMFALRSKENKVNFENIKEIIDYVHSKDKKIYLTLNIYAHNSKLKPLQNTIGEMSNLKPDAFIVSDPGIIQLISEQCSANKIPIHLSTQANTTNWASVKFWQRNGVSRIILARELTLKEISEIKKEVPDIELESFVHGSMCMSYSGRCLLSNFMTGRDANQGTCAQNCRWEYKVFKENREQTAANSKQEIKSLQEIKRSIIEPEDKYFIEEKLRPGEFLPIEEDQFGTYIMSSRDMCSADFLAEIIATGVDSLKVEGRNKSVYYASIVAKVYREIIDKLYSSIEPNYEELISELASTGNRGFIPGFYFGDLQHNSTRYESNKFLQTHTYAGKISCENENEIILDAKNRIDIGDELEIISPTNKFRITINTMTNEIGEELKTIHPGQGKAIIKVDKIISDQLKDKEFILARMKGGQKRN